MGPRLRGRLVVRHQDRGVGRRVQAAPGQRAPPRPERLGHLVRVRRRRQPHRDGLHVAVHDGDAVALRRDHDLGVRHAVRAEGAQQLARLDGHLLLFPTDERHHVAQGVQRRHAGVAGAAQRLHGHHVRGLNPERVVERLERHHQADRRAVGVGDDQSTSSGVPPRLAIHQGQVVRVDLGDQERHRRVEAVVAGVRDDGVAAPRPVGLDVAGDGRVEAGKDHVHVGRRVDALDHERADPGVQHLGLEPARGLAVGPARRPLGGHHRDDLDVGVTGQQADERLADGAGGAQDGGSKHGRRELGSPKGTQDAGGRARPTWEEERRTAAPPVATRSPR